MFYDARNCSARFVLKGVAVEEVNPDIRPDGVVRLLTVKEAAGLCPYSIKTIRRAITAGELSTVSLGHTEGSKRLLLPSALNAWLLSKQGVTVGKEG